MARNANKMRLHIYPPPLLGPGYQTQTRAPKASAPAFARRCLWRAMEARGSTRTSAMSVIGGSAVTTVK